MKQLIQDLKSGETLLAEVPTPQVKSGSVLIQTTHSLVSLGTERMLVEFGKANLIEKARQQPDKVKQVLDKMKSDGVLPTLEAVFNKLGQPLPLGYCNVGRVLEIGRGVKGLKPGDRVVSNGPHAEVVNVPENLVARIPDGVSDEEATFTVIGSIGLQGIRLLNPTFGETVVVIGLGLIGLLAVDLLMANGCRVIGFDFDPQKIELAQTRGVEAINLSEGHNPVHVVEALTQGLGADSVLITASSKSNDVIAQAAQMSRKRGRIVLVGVIGLNISRADFYEKELTFQVSCSYGPGRYDDRYEQQGIDYPLPYVRWTEKRNFEAILQALSTKRLNVTPLITEQVDFEDFGKIYGHMGNKSSIASIMRYSGATNVCPTILLKGDKPKTDAGEIAIIGAGNFTAATMLPALKKNNAPVSWIASSGGLSGSVLAKKFDIDQSTTDFRAILTDPKVSVVAITTRHNSHAFFTEEALLAGKHVFVEKPLCLTTEELDKIISARERSEKSVVVGFNRRFSPHIEAIRRQLGTSGTPINIVGTMNAGFIPQNVWVHDLEVGGGRIIGEACHYLDLVHFLANSPIKAVCMNAMGTNPRLDTDNASILVRFENGSNAVVNYFANGHKMYPKERIEVFADQRVWVMDNFRQTTGYGTGKFKTLKTRQDKGHEEQFRCLVRFAQNKEIMPLIPFASIENVTRASIAAIESLKTGNWVEVPASVTT